ncbi:Uncharacterized protein PBTT_00281 [Plasmodiophora brassicae]|uniref:Uncharacterized protein n=1 Tax=Plasmodiophora brassicae TaxID=37360 RepID=A0A0G4IL86_PLABS|nr:hypothetical protein PBRA_004623 [Plasmodiophora brassicae]SPQ93517.1 unnamed protein product [Plasmodiophora brassicae]
MIRQSGNCHPWLAEDGAVVTSPMLSAIVLVLLAGVSTRSAWAAADDATGLTGTTALLTRRLIEKSAEMGLVVEPDHPHEFVACLVDTIERTMLWTIACRFPDFIGKLDSRWCIFRMVDTLVQDVLERHFPGRYRLRSGPGRRLTYMKKRLASYFSLNPDDVRSIQTSRQLWVTAYKESYKRLQDRTGSSVSPGDALRELAEFINATMVADWKAGQVRRAVRRQARFAASVANCSQPLQSNETTRNTSTSNTSTSNTPTRNTSTSNSPTRNTSTRNTSHPITSRRRWTVPALALGVGYLVVLRKRGPRLSSRALHRSNAEVPLVPMPVRTPPSRYRRLIPIASLLIGVSAVPSLSYLLGRKRTQPTSTVANERMAEDPAGGALSSGSHAPIGVIVGIAGGTLVLLAAIAVVILRIRRVRQTKLMIERGLGYLDDGCFQGDATQWTSMVRGGFVGGVGGLATRSVQISYSDDSD